MDVVIHTDGGHPAKVNADDLNDCREHLFSMLEDGASYDDIMDALGSDLGLEPDYIMDVLGM